MGDAVRIQNEDHRPVAHDRAAGEHRDPPKGARHRLDDDFLGIKNPVDYETKDLIADLHDHDERAFGSGFGASGELKQLAQVDER